jgi:hypothetical protein
MNKFRRALKTKINKGNEEKHVIVQEVKPVVQKHDVLFDLHHLETLLNKNINDVPIYINKFFFKYKNDVFFDNGETFQLLSRVDAKAKIPKNYKKTVSVTKQVNGETKSEQKTFLLSDYFDMDVFLKTNEAKLTIEYDQPYKFVKTEFKRGFEIETNFLNMKKDLPRDYSRKVNMTAEVDEGVKMYFNHIKEVLCSDDEDEYDTVTKFFACSFAGIKVKIALLMLSEEQAGKGTLLNPMEDILGGRMHKTSSLETVEKYTKNFEGTTLVCLDEVPVTGTSLSYQDRLKALITEPTFDCREMYAQSYSQKNTFNIVLCSNNKCILLTQSNNIRFYVLTISNKYAGNKNPGYFRKLHKFLANEDVKVAIYQEFMRIYENDVKPIGWNGTEVKPTRAGTIQRIEALPYFIKHIKRAYLMEGLGIDENSTTFISDYQRTFPRDNISTTMIGKHMTKLNVELKKISNDAGRSYIISFENLKQSFLTLGWLLEEEIEDLKRFGNVEEIKVVEKKDVVEQGVDKTDKSVNVNLLMKQENETLKDQIIEMKRLLAQSNILKVNEPVVTETKPKKKAKKEEVVEKVVEVIQPKPEPTKPKKKAKKEVKIVEEEEETVEIADFLDDVASDFKSFF